MASCGNVIDFNREAAVPEIKKARTYQKDMEEDTRWGHWVVTHDVVFADDGITPIEAQKDITVNPDASLSAQNHWGRGETYTWISGVTMVYVNGKIIPLEKDGDKIEIPRGSIHFSWNPSSDTKGVFHEVQHGPLCDEDDIMRCADKYKKQEQLDSDRDIADMMIAVAKDRYETEDLAADYDQNDFMPAVLEIAKNYDFNFENGDCREELASMFESMIMDAKEKHKALTPQPKGQPKLSVLAAE